MRDSSWDRPTGVLDPTGGLPCTWRVDSRTRARRLRAGRCHGGCGGRGPSRSDITGAPMLHTSKTNTHTQSEKINHETPIPDTFTAPDKTLAPHTFKCVLCGERFQTTLAMFVPPAACPRHQIKCDRCDGHARTNRNYQVTWTIKYKNQSQIDRQTDRQSSRSVIKR
jgi:hypothetical protein